MHVKQKSGSESYVISCLVLKCRVLHEIELRMKICCLEVNSLVKSDKTNLKKMLPFIFMELCKFPIQIWVSVRFCEEITAFLYESIF